MREKEDKEREERVQGATCGVWKPDLGAQVCQALCYNTELSLRPHM